MTRALPVLGCLVLLAAVAVAQQPAVQNGRVEPRKVSALERDVMALGKAATDPIWVGWRVPMIDGDRDLCSSWNTSNTSRGDYIESGSFGTMGVSPVGAAARNDNRVVVMMQSSGQSLRSESPCDFSSSWSRRATRRRGSPRARPHRRRSRRA